jgi:hypothetical protein
MVRLRLLRDTAYAVLIALVGLLLVASSYAPSSASTRTLPPGGTDWDYQPGGTRPVPARVGIVVLAVEYAATSFRKACRNWSDRIAVVRRDVNLTRHGLRRWCG